MKWTEIQAEGDVGKTFVAQIPRGVLVRVVTKHPSGGATEALTFVPGERRGSFEAAERPAPGEKLNPDDLSTEDRELWDKVKAETPDVTEYTNAQFQVLKAGLRALQSD